MGQAFLSRRGGLDDDLSLSKSIVDRSIQYINNDSWTIIESYAFYGCIALKTAYFIAVTEVGNNAFSGCRVLNSIRFPALEEINNSAFSSCHGLKKADFYAVKSIGSLAFDNCTNLKTLILRRTDQVCALTSYQNLFAQGPIASGTGYIYVPKTLDDGSDGVSAYKAATNWSIYKDQIRAIEDYPDITGG